MMVMVINGSSYDVVPFRFPWGACGRQYNFPMFPLSLSKGAWAPDKQEGAELHRPYSAKRISA